MLGLKLNHVSKRGHKNLSNVSVHFSPESDWQKPSEAFAGEPTERYWKYTTESGKMGPSPEEDGAAQASHGFHGQSTGVLWC